MGDDFTLAFVVAGATIEQGAASDRKHPRLIFGRIHVVQNIKGTLVRRPTTEELSTSWDLVRTGPHLAQKGFGERIDVEGDEPRVEIQFLSSSALGKVARSRIVKRSRAEAATDVRR